jgi:hypothetical protein
MHHSSRAQLCSSSPPPLPRIHGAVSISISALRRRRLCRSHLPPPALSRCHQARVQSSTAICGVASSSPTPHPTPLLSLKAVPPAPVLTMTP